MKERLKQVERKRFSWVNQEFKRLIEDSNITIPQIIKKFTTEIYYRVRRDLDLYIAITGWEGFGKSSAAMLFGKLIDSNFTLENNILYSPTIEEMNLKINYRKLIQQGKEIPKGALKPHSVLIVDEAIKVVYKMEQWSGLQRFLKKLFALARTENKIIILCIPDFLDMGNNFRKRMNYWVDIFAREKEKAYCVVEAASKNKYKNDRWNLKEHEKLYEKEVGSRKYANLAPLEHLDIIKKISKNYVFSFFFHKLPEVIFNKYMELKNSYDYDSQGELKEFERDSKYKKLFNEQRKLFGKALGELKDSGDFSNKTLGLKFGKSASLISDLIIKAREDVR